MSPRLKTTLALVGSFLLGAGLLYLAFRGADFDAIGAAITGADWRWLPVLVFLTMFSNGLRAWRWVLLIEALPEEERVRAERGRTSVVTAFGAIMIGYMVNYAAPRVGEVARTAHLSVRSGRSFAGVLGTVVADRVLDVLALLVALVSVVLLFGERLIGIQTAMTSQLSEVLEGLPVLWIGVLGAGLLLCVGLLVWWVRRDRAARVKGEPGRFQRAAAGFRDGLASVLRTRNQVGLWGSTALMWFCYLWMAYLPLLLLRIEGLGLLDAWALVVVGAVGMALPAPGGTGSYHYATVQTMTILFAVTQADAVTYALLSHGAMLVMYVTAGFGFILAQGASLGSLKPSSVAAPPDPAPAEVTP